MNRRAWRLVVLDCSPAALHWPSRRPGRCKSSSTAPVSCAQRLQKFWRDQRLQQLCMQAA